MVEMMWHRRETRRKLRTQTSTYSVGRSWSTRLCLTNHSSGRQKSLPPL